MKMRKVQQHNPVADLMRLQLDASIELADAMFSGTEKIDRAVLDVTHHTVEGQLKLARAVADLREPGKLAELQSSIAERPERTIRCQQEIMAALVEMQSEFGKSIRHYIERMSQTAAEQADEVSERFGSAGQQTPGAAANPFTGMLSVWEQAFREASRLANQNMVAAQSSMESATHGAHEAVSRTMEAGAVIEHAHAHARGTKARGARK